jgi:FMN phosphatase YigB (HAD superfamily)
MVGDDPVVDIAGAMSVGMDAIFFNPFHAVNTNPKSKAISTLNELIDLLG